MDANKHLEDEDPLVLTIQTPDLGLKIVDISDKGNLSLKPIYSEDSKSIPYPIPELKNCSRHFLTCQ
ncbi:hypothetical protein EJ377_16040 [Chryseobacterium arthrosphaerae]|uniref:Uncharacterized protein n=1 Tax=Chryseobacterium arthrosphaerae TaxID=651561 RepID=A0A3S0Q3Y5_9FLAO|nr:hypothetical protein EJ377_16040 [Chryseobacterium arthrosphaerae]